MADRKLSELAELTTPASDDEFLVLDASEPTDANKNKRILFGTLCDHIPDGSVASPSLGFVSDAGDTGFFRSGDDEIAISTFDTLNSKFTTTGFQVGDGTASAQFHTFKSTTGDDVIIENTEPGAAEGPNVVLYRNSASPAVDDVIGTLEFRGEDDAAETVPYVEITGGIVDPVNGSEDGRLDVNLTTAGSSSTIVRLQEGRIGINEPAPEAPIHVNNTDTQILRLECPNNDASSGADIRMYRHRNDAVGQNGDQLSTLFFRGNNNDATESQRPVDYAAIQGQISDVTADTEEGKIVLQVQVAGTLQTQLEVGSDIVLAPSSGNVGIGTASADALLHVSKSTGAEIRIDTGGGVNADSVLGFRENGVDRARIYWDGLNNDLYLESTIGNFCINPASNVGVGTTSPASTFHVQAASLARIQVETESNTANSDIAFYNSDGLQGVVGYGDTFDSLQIDSRSTTGAIVFTRSGSERMRIRSNGVINYANCPTYADDTAAGTGGLVAGDIYKTSTGELRIKL